MVRANSDHNIIKVVIRVTGKNHYSKEILTSVKRNMDIDRYKVRIDNIYWVSLNETNDINIANSIFKEDIVKLWTQRKP